MGALLYAAESLADASVLLRRAARTLFVRTIQSQLYRAYDKLGITGRSESAEALKDRSSPT
jgi:site-specific recombinase